MTDNYGITGGEAKLTDDERTMLLDRRMGSPTAAARNNW